MEKTLEIPELITIYSPDSITSDRIWCRYQNVRLLNQRNSPPGKYDPRSHLQRTLADIMIRRLGQIDDKITTSVQAEYSVDYKQIEKTITSWSKRRLQADQRDDYKLIKGTITSRCQSRGEQIRKRFITVSCKVCIDCKPWLGVIYSKEIIRVFCDPLPTTEINRGAP